MAKERLSLYFDTDIPSERRMWEYICKDGKNRKSRNVKIALEMILEGISIKPAVVDNKDESKNNENGKLVTEDNTVISTNDANDIGDEELPF